MYLSFHMNIVIHIMQGSFKLPPVHFIVDGTLDTYIIFFNFLNLKFVHTIYLHIFISHAKTKLVFPS